MKKLIIIVLIIFFVIICFLGFIEYNKRAQQIAVLSYHNIIPDGLSDEMKNEYTLTVSEFNKQMEYLYKNGYRTISAEEMYKWKNKEIDLPHKSVLITFDDGYCSFKYIVEPILEKYNFKAICFIIGESTEKLTPNYDPNTYGTIGKDEIENHINNVEYGSHTYSMHHLTSDNKRIVEISSIDELKKDVELFNNNVFEAEYLAYPYYTYTKDYINVLKEYNYKLAFAGEEEMATRGVNNYKIPRISGVKSFEEFKEILETDKYKNKYGNGFIRKVCVNIERRLK